MLHKSSLLRAALLSAALGCLTLVAVAREPQAQERGVKLLSIRDIEGREVGWYGGSFALLIGNSEYQNGWQRLDSIPQELAQVRAVLEQHGFVVEQVNNTRSDQLYDAFKSFIDRHGYTARNRLLFYFAGHGYSRRDGQRAYLVPIDAPRPSLDETGFLTKALPFEQVIAWAKQIEAMHAIFLFDSCFSGGIFKVRADSPHPPYIDAELMRPVRQFITAGSAEEEVPAKSVFAPLFVKALRGEADRNRDGFVVGTELGLFLREGVLEQRTGQTPQFGKIRDPELDEGDFVFRVDAVTERPTAPPPPQAGPVRAPPTPKELLAPVTLRSGQTTHIASLQLDLSLRFEETLGNRHGAILLSPSDTKPRKLPVLSSGAASTFTTLGASYELQVLTLDEAAGTMVVKIRPLP